MKTLLEVVNAASDYFREKAIERPKREAEDLISFALGLKRIDIYLYYDRPLVEEELIKCREFIKKRMLGTPSQYIMGEVFFAGCKIKVTPAVLIPRPETEILVEMCARVLAKENLEGKTLLDLCTGSGCIAIALKKRFPKLSVIASDISKNSLAIAKENAALNEVEIEFLEGDLQMAPCDFFISNPPYISKKDYECLSKEVREYEPKEALLGGESGLEFYEKIAFLLPQFLASSGKGWLEIGFDQGEAVKKLFKQKGTIEKDWAGHDRFLCIYPSNQLGN